MKRLFVGTCAFALSTLAAVGPAPVAGPSASVAAPATSTDSRALPMHFELRREGPADACGRTCRTWISAIGAITPDTPRDFENFAKANDIRGATIALDSDGGSVLGALAFGRAVRGLGMTTTVGKTIDLPASATGEKRAKLKPRAYCESMCAFVLLAGVERHVPAEARVMVHQIWLGDRRDDPTAANYSAEDLVLVQRDIGRLAHYTVEMGGSIDLLETALKIPPWEPMRLLSRDELRGMKIVTKDEGPEIDSGATATSVPMASGARAPINDRSWAMSEKAGRMTLARKHPLTVEGDDIGTFELTLGCGESGKSYSLTYVEQRRATARGRAPEALVDVGVMLSGKSLPLTIVSSRPGGGAQEFESVASGAVPADLIRAFADPKSRSITIETSSQDLTTAIRVGNVGVSRSFAQLAASCVGQAMAETGVRTGLRREAEAQPR